VALIEASFRAHLGVALPQPIDHLLLRSERG
jgi:hypothetical protein